MTSNSVSNQAKLVLTVMEALDPLSQGCGPGNPEQARKAGQAALLQLSDLATNWKTEAIHHSGRRQQDSEEIDRLQTNVDALTRVLLAVPCPFGCGFDNDPEYVSAGITLVAGCPTHAILMETRLNVGGE